MDFPEDRQRRIEAFLGDKFKIISTLGASRRSATFRAVQAADQQVVALKVMSYDPKVEGIRLAQVMNLVSQCLKLEHPHVVRVLGCGFNHDEHWAFFVMELVEGPTLKDYFEQRAEDLTLGSATRLFQQIASGIDEMHRERLIHRDIKPENIFFSATENAAKIGDFGGAIGLGELEGGDSGACQALGTPAYMAPEQIIGTRFDYRVDLYAFSMTIYFLLTGKVAFDARSRGEYLFAQMDATPLPISRRNRNWPATLDRALLRSLSKRPEDRHSSAGALAAEVQEALEPFTPLRLSSFQEGLLGGRSSQEVLLPTDLRSR